MKKREKNNQGRSRNLVGKCRIDGGRKNKKVLCYKNEGTYGGENPRSTSIAHCRDKNHSNQTMDNCLRLRRSIHNTTQGLWFFFLLVVRRAARVAYWKT